ncbi:hypothetical protein RYA05_02305 [Pseudomonas syringae pv. actinidiae]|nr:hypothetical protein [Pseudomonas syringae pv. actinidiae]
MEQDKQAFIESVIKSMKTEFYHFQPGRVPTLQQATAGASLSYMYLEEIAQDREEVFERCKARMGFYTGYFILNRKILKEGRTYWDKETHINREVTLRAIGASLQEVFDAAHAALREELVKFPAKSEPEGL